MPTVQEIFTKIDESLQADPSRVSQFRFRRTNSTSAARKPEPTSWF